MKASATLCPPSSKKAPRRSGALATAARAAVLTLIAALAAGCSGDGDAKACADAVFATSAVSGARAVHVAAGCGDDQGDGSRDAPFATIAAAAAAAKPGDTLLVAAGSYAEGVALPAGVHLEGAGADAVTIAPPAGKRGVEVPAGAAEIRVAGVRVEGATSSGISSKGAPLLVAAVAVHGTKPGDTAAGGEAPGHGVVAQGAGALRIESSVISDNAGLGVGAYGSGPVTIIDPIFDGGPSGTFEGGVAIIDPIFAPASQISGNGAGGVAIIDPIFAPGGKTDGEVPSLTLHATDVLDNKGYAVAVFGGSVSVVRSALCGSRAAAGSDIADGLVLAAGSDAARVGAAVVDASSVIADNGRAQGSDAKVRLGAGARVVDNALVGVGVTGGARLEGKGAVIERTRNRTFNPIGGGDPESIGDGVGVFEGGGAVLEGCTFDANARAGLLGHRVGVDAQGAAVLDVKGNTFKGGDYGIAINAEGAKGISDTTLITNNTFEGAKTDFEEKAALPVRVSPCGDGKDAAAACGY
jgi:hypothetical protein